MCSRMLHGPSRASSSPSLVCHSDSSVVGVGRSSPSGPSRRTTIVLRDMVSGDSRAKTVMTLTPGRSATSARGWPSWDRRRSIGLVEDLARPHEDVGVEQLGHVARRRAHLDVALAGGESGRGDVDRRRRVAVEVVESRRAEARVPPRSTSLADDEREAAPSQIDLVRSRRPLPSAAARASLRELAERARARLWLVEEQRAAAARANRARGRDELRGGLDRDLDLLARDLAQIAIADRELDLRLVVGELLPTSNVKATLRTSPGCMFETSKRPSWRSRPSPERLRRLACVSYERPRRRSSRSGTW